MLQTASVMSPHVPAQSAAVIPSADDRWTAWQAKGTAHDRIVRQRAQVAVPLLLIGIGVLYFLFAR
jgi:hypothetical protein